MNEVPSPVNAKALLWTGGVHLALFALFFLCSFRIITPGTEVPVQELGMEVNLGTDLTGSGTDQPMSIEDPAASPGGSATAAGESAEQEYAENNDPDAELLASSPSRRPSTRPATTAAASPRSSAATTTNRNSAPPAPTPRYTYSGDGGGGNRASENRPGSGEGPGNGAGDAGVAGGTPGAANYSGTPGRGSGGISHTLNRSLAQQYRLSGQFRNGGRVTAFITVNRDGAIISSRITKSPSGELTALAKEKLRVIRYTASPSAPPEQSGYIHLDFTTASGR